MADGSDGSREAAWLEEMVRAVRRAADGASDPAAFGRAVTDGLAGVEPNRFAWLGHVGAGHVSVRCTSGEEQPPARLRFDATDAPAGTTAAGAGGEVAVLSDLAASPAYTALREHVAVPPAERGVCVPFSPGSEASAGVVCLYTDVEASAATVRELAAVLGETVGETVRSVARAADRSREQRRLEEARRTLSHDFGNPVNLAAGRLELVARECESEHLAYVEQGLDRINALASDCQLFIEVGQPVERWDSRSLGTIARHCWEAIGTGGSTLETGDVSVRGDPGRLSRLLTELLENAVEHTDGPVGVAVGPLDDDPGFHVTDTGDGVPADEREFVFDRGYSTVTDRKGNGLAIAREITGAHGWQLRLADTEEGARFEVVTDRWVRR
jgi:signal transduction histidine kinase